MAKGTTFNMNKTPAASVWDLDIDESVKNGVDGSVDSSTGPWATVTEAKSTTYTAPTYSRGGWGEMPTKGSGRAPASKGKFISFSCFLTL